MRPFTIISFGQDATPDVQCVVAETAAEAVRVAAFQNGGCDIHGVYPGWIGDRILVAKPLPGEAANTALAYARRAEKEARDLMDEALSAVLKD